MKLELTHPSIGTFAFELQPGGDLVLGRDTTDADIELRWDPHVSRRHARLYFVDGGVWYDDLDSRNGSRRDGLPLTGPIELRAGDRIQLGDTLLSLADRASDPWADVTEVEHELGSTDTILSGPVTAEDPPLPNTRFVGPTRVRIEGTGLQRMWTEELSKGRLFVPGPCPVGSGTRVWIDVTLEDGYFEISAEVVHVGAGEDGVFGAGLAVGTIPSALRRALVAGADATATSTVEIEPPKELLDLPPAPEAPLPPPPGVTDADVPEPGIQRFIGLVVDKRFYEALDVLPQATDAELRVALASWEERARQPGGSAAFQDLRAPLARALGIVREQLAETKARLRYDFGHGYVLAEHRLALARRGEGPSMEVLASAWRRVFPVRSERARRLWASAREAEAAGRAEEAERLRTQARQLAPFQHLGDPRG